MAQKVSWAVVFLSIVKSFEERQKTLEKCCTFAMESVCSMISFLKSRVRASFEVNIKVKK